MPKFCGASLLVFGAIASMALLPLAAQAQFNTTEIDSSQPQERSTLQTRQNLIGSAVVLRTLDKVTATTQDYTLKIGDTLQYGSLTIAARHCEKKPPEDIPETYAFLQIKDARLTGGGETADEDLTVFSGWMFASKPAISALDHRVYDVWVIDCKIPQKPADEGLLRR
jgi:hypothetical protein